MLQRISGLLLIKHGEQQQVFYFLILFFFVGTGMAVGRSASEALFFKRYGIEYLPLMFIINSVLLCAISILYAAFVDLLPSEKFYKILFIVLALSLLGNWYAATFSTTTLVYPAFFLLYEVASELLLIHCAVYINQNLLQTQSKRLTPVILAGHQTGVISGGILLASTSPILGVKNMMLLWISLLIISYLLIASWHSKIGVSPYFRSGRKGSSKLKQSIDQLAQGTKLMKTSRLLRMSSFGLFFKVISVYVLAYAVNNIYTEQFKTEESLGSFFGLLTAATGTIALLLQLFITNRLIRDQGIKRVNLIFPVASIFSYCLLLFSFALPSAIFGSFSKETLMPAFSNPVRNIFNASLPARLQGRAQAISVILVIPLGLTCAGVFLMLAQSIENIHNFLIIGLICSIAYLIFNNEMNQAYAQEILSNLKKRLFIPDNQLNDILHGSQHDAIKDIEQGLKSDEDEISLVYARVLSKSAPDRAAILIPQRMKNTGNAVKDQMIKILQSIQSADLRKCLVQVIGSGDTKLDATIFKALFHSRDIREKHRVKALLSHEHSRMKSAGIYGVLHYPVPELFDIAIDKWNSLLNSKQAENYMPAVELLVPEFKALYLQPPLRETVWQKLMQMLQQDDTQRIKLALEILSGWPPAHYEIKDQILSLSNSSDWAIRNACLNTSHLLPETEVRKLLLASLEDQHPNVRRTAIRILASGQTDDIGYIQNMLVDKHAGSPRSIKTMLEYLMNAGADAGTMLAISLSLANDARKLRQASIYLKNSGLQDSPEVTLLSHALEERVIDTTDLSLFAIQTSNHDGDIAVIRAGLNSNDSRQFSNACELLTMLNNRELTDLILPLFEEVYTGKKNRHENMLFDNISTLITWIQNRSDPWLSECANHFSAILNNKTYV